MPVESVHASKGLLTAFTRVGPDIEVEGLVALAVVLSGKALVAAGPLALEGALLIV